MNYYASFAPGTPGRTHLRDEAEFLGLTQSSASACQLNSVSFVKPVGLENEHPGYTDLASGDQHAGAIIDKIRHTKLWATSTIIVKIRNMTLRST